MGAGDGAGPGTSASSRLRLPSGRAVVGSLLVVVAATGVLAAHRAATAPTTSRYVVAAHDVAPGAVLRSEDLGTLAMDLPDGVAAVPADRARTVVGTVAVHGLSELDLVRPDDVEDARLVPAGGSVQVPVEVDRARALDGAISAGSRIDVLATDPDGAGTTVLARDVLVVHVDGHDRDGIGSSDGVTFRLAVADQETASAVVDAAVRSQITFVLPATTTGGRDDG